MVHSVSHAIASEMAMVHALDLGAVAKYVHVCPRVSCPSGNPMV